MTQQITMPIFTLENARRWCDVLPFQAAYDWYGRVRYWPDKGPEITMFFPLGTSPDMGKVRRIMAAKG